MAMAMHLRELSSICLQFLLSNFPYGISREKKVRILLVPERLLRYFFYGKSKCYRITESFDTIFKLKSLFQFERHRLTALSILLFSKRK